jgi:para-nitrobenzyl esterase
MIGSTSEEEGVDPTTSQATANTQIQTEFGANSNAILADYPFTAYPSPGWAVAQAYSDESFACVDRYTARHVAAAGGQSVFRYVFAHGLTQAPPTPGAYHRLDIGFVLGDITAESNGPYTPSAAELALSRSMMDAWYRFAAVGDPGAWPKTTSNGGVMIWNTTSSVVPDYHPAACELSWPLSMVL